MNIMFTIQFQDNYFLSPHSVVRCKETSDDWVNLLQSKADVGQHDVLFLGVGQELQLPVHISYGGLQAAGGQMLQQLCSNTAKTEAQILADLAWKYKSL